MITTTSQSHPVDIGNRQRIYASGLAKTENELKEIRRRIEQAASRGGLTSRDERLLEYLRELNVLTIAQVQRLLWPSAQVRTAYKRINDLANLGLVGRVRTLSVELEAWGLTSGIVYTLAAGGRMWLHDEVSDDYVARRLKRDQVIHDLLGAELGVRLTEATLSRGQGWEINLAGERAASFYERDAALPLVRPDALVVVRHWQTPGKAATLPLFVEIDASREAHGRPSSDWGRKVHGYDAVSAGQWQQHPVLSTLGIFPRVLVVTHGAQRLQNLAAAIGKHRRQPVVYQLGQWAELIAAEDVLTAPIWTVINPDGQLASGQPLIPAAKPTE